MYIKCDWWEPINLIKCVFLFVFCCKQIEILDNEPKKKRIDLIKIHCWVLRFEIAIFYWLNEDILQIETMTGKNETNICSRKTKTLTCERLSLSDKISLAQNRHQTHVFITYSWYKLEKLGEEEKCGFKHTKHKQTKNIYKKKKRNKIKWTLRWPWMNAENATWFNHSNER